MRSLIRFPGAAGILALLAGAAAAQAADIKVFCSLPIRHAMPGLADTFHRATGHRVDFVFDLSPDLAKQVAAGKPADLVILAQGYFEELAKTGKLAAGSRAVIGRVGVGLAVRAGVALPDISTRDALKRALLDADSLAYGELASGVHFARVLEGLGIAAEVKAKSRRYIASDAVFEHILTGKGKDIGVGPMTQIIASSKKGLSLVGPLPAALQEYEPYIAGLPTSAKSPEAARAFVKFLASPSAVKALAAAGVGQPR
jgi:molybdate transport system substrate-binding protein